MLVTDLSRLTKLKFVVMTKRLCKSEECIESVKVCTWGEWPDGLNSFRQVTELKLG